ncbi:hypothetical protein J6590_023178 [Homalodisca vitripennis]|nr:hypothetical protein J6590_023178 [Homalodisca vitripennis]
MSILFGDETAQEKHCEEEKPDANAETEEKKEEQVKEKRPVWQKQQKKGKKSGKKQPPNKRQIVKDAVKQNNLSKENKEKIAQNSVQKTEETEEKLEKDKTEKKKEKSTLENKADGAGDRSDADESDLSDDEAEKSDDEGSQTDSKKKRQNELRAKGQEKYLKTKIGPGSATPCGTVMLLTSIVAIVFKNWEAAWAIKISIINIAETSLPYVNRLCIISINNQQYIHSKYL